MNNESVTVVVTHSIREGREADFDAWLVGVLTEAERFSGYQGYVEIPPGKDPLERHIAFRFDSVAQLNDFWCSEIYAEWKDRLVELISAPSHYRQEFGIEHWFLAPNCIVAPSWHRMSVVVFLSILPLSYLIPQQLSPWFSQWMPQGLARVLTTAVIVTLMSYVVMPFTTRVFRSWLNPTSA